MTRNRPPREGDALTKTERSVGLLAVEGGMNSIKKRRDLRAEHLTSKTSG